MSLWSSAVTLGGRFALSQCSNDVTSHSCVNSVGGRRMSHLGHTQVGRAWPRGMIQTSSANSPSSTQIVQFLTYLVSLIQKQVFHLFQGKKKDTRKILQLKVITAKFTNCLFKNPWSRYKGAPPAQTPSYPSEIPQQCPIFTPSMCTTSTVCVQSVHSRDEQVRPQTPWWNQ